MVASISIVTMIIATSVDIYFGLLFLLAGFFAVNKEFAILNIRIGSVPIYLPEVFLTVALIKFFIAYVRKAHRPHLPTTFVVSWMLYVLVGLISLITGLRQYPVLDVIRDSALFYYSLVMIPVIVMDLSSKRILNLLQTLLGVGVVKAILIVIQPYLTAHYNFPELQGQPAGNTMYLAITLLFQFVFLSTCGYSWLMSIASGFSVAGLLFYAVRSSWSGFAVAYLVILGLLYVYCRQSLLKSYKQQIFGLVLGFLIAWVFPYLFNGYIGTSTRLVGRVQSVFSTAGSDSRYTRILLWKDALSEVFSVGMFSENVKPSDLAKYKLPKMLIVNKERNTVTIPVVYSSYGDGKVNLKNASPEIKDLAVAKAPLVEPINPSSEPKALIIPVVARGHTGESIRIQLDSSGTNKNNIFDVVERYKKIIFGLPFGKMFYPPEVAYWLHDTNRYDPHNSFVAILYRLGLLGLCSFLLIVYSFFRQSIRLLCQQSHSNFNRLFLIGVFGSVIYHLVHSLTDVVFENAFKGLILWVFIAIVFNNFWKETSGNEEMLQKSLPDPPNSVPPKIELLRTHP